MFSLVQPYLVIIDFLPTFDFPERSQRVLTESLCSSAYLSRILRIKDAEGGKKLPLVGHPHLHAHVPFGEVGGDIEVPCQESV